MKKIVSFALAAMCSALALGAETPPAPERVSILAPVTYAVEAPVPERVRQECQIERQVVDALHETLAEKGMGGAVVASAGDGLVLKVTIERVIGQGGGGWSGPKTLTLGVALLRAGSVERTTSQSYATRSLNPLAGSCASYERAASKVSELIARWLKAPTRASASAVPPASLPSE
jgi:hypothetical protein